MCLSLSTYIYTHTHTKRCVDRGDRPQCGEAAAQKSNYQAKLRIVTRMPTARGEFAHKHCAAIACAHILLFLVVLFPPLSFACPFCSARCSQPASLWLWTQRIEWSEVSRRVCACELSKLINAWRVHRFSVRDLRRGPIRASGGVGRETLRHSANPSRRASWQIDS